MPIHTIREVLKGKVTATGTFTSNDMVQKRINLPHGRRFKILSIECFDDNMNVAPTNDKNSVVTREIYVTPHPIIPTNQPFGFTTEQRDATSAERKGVGAFAGDASVLYKRLDWTWGDRDSVTANPEVGSYNPYIMEFPNPQTANNNPFTWYTPHLYLTCKINQDDDAKDSPIALSFFIRYESKAASATECAMGLYKEQLEAQQRMLLSTANTIDPVGSAAGRSFPSWLYGGARPEIMISSSNVLRYYNKLAASSYQEMDDIFAFRDRFKEATTMVAYDEPFGQTQSEIPDWITLMDVAGVTSGPIRSYPPPVKFSGNGNTVMYDSLGQPASIVT